MEKFVAVWIAPVVTGVIVAWLSSRLLTKKLRGHLDVSPNQKAQNDVEENRNPLIKKYDKQLPFGYYKLSEGKAKRMESEFYMFLMQYFKRMIYIWMGSIFVLVISFSSILSSKDSNVENAVPVFVMSLILAIGLAPWRSSGS